MDMEVAKAKSLSTASVSTMETRGSFDSARSCDYFSSYPSSSGSSLPPASSYGSFTTASTLTTLPPLVDVDREDNLFQQPCQPFPRHGRYSAPLFRVRMLDDTKDLQGDRCVGKDLAHARHEADFYRRLTHLCEHGSPEEQRCWAGLMPLMLRYMGVASLRCVDPYIGDKVVTRDLLVLENFSYGFGNLRLLDIKLGAQTAVAGWKGKGRLNALRNGCIDRLTNSAREGFRVEGFEAPPNRLQRDIARFVSFQKGRKRNKYVKEQVLAKFGLQRLCAAEFLAAWLDTSGLGRWAEAGVHDAVWSACDQLGHLLEGVAKIPAPQQWIGSSLALGWEAGPGASSSSQEVTSDAEAARRPALVKVFDWGRSEPSSLQDHARLRPLERRERVRHWRHYAQAVARLQWELCRIAMHRCCCSRWSSLVFELWEEPTCGTRSGAGSRCYAFGLQSLHPAPARSADAVEVEIPLLEVSSVAASCGTLRCRVQTSTRDKSDQTSTRLSALQADLSPEVFFGLDRASLSLRILAFEDSREAEQHMLARRRPCLEEIEGFPLLPRRRCVCAQATASTFEVRARPSDREGGSMLHACWGDASFEYLSLGSAGAVEASERLLRLLPERAAAAAAARQGAAPFFASLHWLLPPPDLGLPSGSVTASGSVSTAPPKAESSQPFADAAAFIALAIPWAPHEAPVPPRWL
eukprot:TRINITY_DN8436_c0_g1_i1.p1 TRINITY_DN8436_c0_g1~~TRINITY_DN8436_c0_g1_i1.p1  ORF type:complete len:794 (-),score=113.95 TRINITY_DN8436_c0_g1_i1:213-2291(-)